MYYSNKSKNEFQKDEPIPIASNKSKHHFVEDDKFSRTASLHPLSS